MERTGTEKDLKIQMERILLYKSCSIYTRRRSRRFLLQAFLNSNEGLEQVELDSVLLLYEFNEDPVIQALPQIQQQY